jgi:hypothetical protein
MSAPYSRAFIFQEGDKGYTNLSLEFYEAVVRPWHEETFLCKEIEIFRISKRGGMEEDNNRHHLATGHGEFGIPLFLFLWDRATVPKWL